ncbi:hypothetical protein INT48_004481 [Thamnidium elegans]|uniref:Uncharacterized protein n=1 Tax=Thamnidium elegans TaxID=101142 RepID=A0A8H7W3V0_9FUNG|nr:hypothetical protein INT48_004481 [Thamnidium elegans]
MIAAKEKVHDRLTITGLNTLANMSQSVERSQADYIKSLEKQSNTQKTDNDTQEVADTTTQELDDELNNSITQEVGDESITEKLELCGEDISEAIKVSIDMNRSLFGLREQSSSYGRRIDLILRKKRVKVSSNEWKRNVTSQEVVQKQQCKSPKTNACIIQQIMTRYKINTSAMAMNFVGNCSCLYTLTIPYHVDHLSALKPALNAVFHMKSFLIDQTRNINEAMFELDVGNTLPFLNLPSPSTASASTIPASYIL